MGEIRNEARRDSRREVAFLAGDGFLITAGTVAAGLALSYGLAALQRFIGSAVLGLGSGFLLLASGAAGVVIAWLLHGRRITGSTVVGGIVGWFLAALIVPLAPGVSYLLGVPLALVSDSEFAGALALLALLSASAVALIAWLLADAVRDMAPARREHVRLDWARISAAIAFAALVAVSVYLVLAQPGPEQGEAPIWAMAAGFIGAGMLVAANYADILWGRRHHARPALPTG